VAVRTKVEPLERDIAVIVDEELSPAAQSKALANFAREVLAEAKETNRRVLGRVPPYQTFVDGREGASVDHVKPAGTIVYEFDLIDDVLIFIGEELRKVSPFLSGRYRKSHSLFADGVEVPIGGVVPVADEYVFLSGVPYARKIEGGPGRKPLSKQAPKGVYQMTAARASRRFGNLARIKFSFRAPIGGSILNYQPAGTANAAVSRRGGVEQSNRLPAIVVTMR